MIDQVGIIVFGITAVYLTQEKKASRRKWASVFGLLSQPFWFYSAYHSGQWGVFVLTFVYALIWAKGFYTNWIAK